MFFFLCFLFACLFFLCNHVPLFPSPFFLAPSLPIFTFPVLVMWCIYFFNFFSFFVSHSNIVVGRCTKGRVDLVG